jgi:small subunit ribosomal protein S9
MADETQTPTTTETPRAEPQAPSVPTPEQELAALAGAGPATTLGAPETAPKPLAPEPPDAHGWWWGTGRRKSAVARVRIKPGSGKFLVQVNRKKTKPVNEYFTELRDQNDVVAPLKETGALGKLDIVARAGGGGYMGQAGAVVLGLSRALKKYDPSLEATLREHGFLTRDPREVERKKYGQAGARRRFQFSKR